MPKFKHYSSSQEIAKAVAQIFIKQVKHKPNSVFILATGSSPLLTYGEIIEDYKINHTDWSQIKTFNLDEYIDLNPQYSNQSYRYFMNSNLFSKININLNNTFFPSKQTINGKYDLMIQNAGGANIALLGVGVNGHIAFNEPNSSIDSITRIVDLTSSTKEANARFFDNHSDFVPKQAVTCGLSTILAAKQIILIATGSNKKTALTQLKHATSFDPNWPITALYNHLDTIIYTDQEID